MVYLLCTPSKNSLRQVIQVLVCSVRQSNTVQVFVVNTLNTIVHTPFWKICSCVFVRVFGGERSSRAPKERDEVS